MPALRSDISYVKGIHNIKAGVTYEQTFLTENDSFGIVDPTLLDVMRLPGCEWQSDRSAMHRPGALRPDAPAELYSSFTATRT